MMILWVTILLQAPVQVAPTPFEIREDGASLFDVKAVSQILRVGDELYIRSARDPSITVISTDGDILRAIGRRGSGPGEFQSGVQAMVVTGNGMWAVGTTRRTTASYFVEGAFEKQIDIEPWGPRQLTMSSNLIAAREGVLIVPVVPSLDALAYAYGEDGSIKGLGELLYTRENREVIQKVPGINHTTWLAAGDFFYALFAYQPRIEKFDGTFRRVAVYEWTSVQIRKSIDELFDPPENRTLAPLLFTDFKVRGTELFVMGQGTLYRIDQVAGTLTGRWSFFLADEKGGSRRHHFHCFEFLPNSDLILGNFFGDPAFLMTASLREGPK